MNIKLKRSEAIYLICYVFFIVSSYIFGEIMNKPRAMWLICPIISLGIVVSVIIRKHTIKNLSLRLIIILVFCIASVVSRMPQMLVYATLICGADSTSFQRVCRYCLYTCTIFVIMTMILNLFGIIPDVGSWYRFGVHIRSFGFGYYSIVPFTFLYMVLIYLYLQYEKQRNASWLEMLVIALLNYLLFSVTTLRLTYYLVYLTLFMYIILIKFEWFNLKNKLINFLTILIFPSMFALVIWINYVFTYSDPMLFQLNRLLSNRLALGHEAIQRYSINLLGNYIEVNNSEIASEYFYIDSGFLFSLLGYGLLFTALLLIIYMYLHNYFASTNNKMMFIWLTIVAVFSTTNNTWISLQYNPIVLMLPMILKEVGVKEKILYTYKSGRRRSICYGRYKSI